MKLQRTTHPQLEKREEWARQSRREFARRFQDRQQNRENRALVSRSRRTPQREAWARRSEPHPQRLDRGCNAAEWPRTTAAPARKSADALDRSIYSDDADAVETLTARIAEREAEREKMKTVNKLYRKGRRRRTRRAWYGRSKPSKRQLAEG